jgi:hypothetical protein
MKIHYSDVKFLMNGNSFVHNQANDFACFALWESARPFADKIREYLSSTFEILLETEVKWSEEHFHNNASRLYEFPIYSNILTEKENSSYAKKIGDKEFIFFVVKDTNPDYSYAMSVSKKIELSNLNIVRAKYTFRDWVTEKSNVKYAIHSSNNIYEFLFQTPLILGVNLFNDLLDGNKPIIPKISKDLEGANGWSSWKELFDVLNITNNYLILRNFEGLPYKNFDKDIDMLTDNYQRVASAIGAQQSTKKNYKASVIIENARVPFDIRFVGDKYYDCSWQKDMLESKVNIDGVNVPRSDHHFFSLLYHCRVQKQEVKEKYFDILKKLSKELNFNWYSDTVLKDDSVCGELLDGFLKANNYYYENPIDNQVYKNKNIIKFLPNLNSIKVRESTKSRAKRFIINNMSAESFLFLKKIKDSFIPKGNERNEKNK